MKLTQAVFLIAIFILMSQITRSQPEYGRVLLSGQIALNSISVTTPGSPGGYSENVKSVGIAPIAGYFIFQNFAAGMQFLFNYKKTPGSYGVTATTLRSLSFVPFLRYYLINGKIRPYFEAGAGPGFGKSTSKSGIFPQSTQKSKIMVYEMKGGIELLVNKHVGLDADFGYSSTTNSFNNGSEWKTTIKGTTGSVALIIYL
jgi:hypothetical protein